MANSIVVLLAIAFAATTLAASSPSLKPTPTEAQQKILDRFQNETDWVTVGQVGNKTFIVYTQLNNWMAGRGICPSAELEYATFESREEFSFLQANYKTGAWISARIRGAEEFEPSAYEWDSNGGAVPHEINFHMFSDHWLCLYFTGDDHTYTDFCLSGQHQTLCQLRIG